MQLPTGGAQAVRTASENTTVTTRTPQTDPPRRHLWWFAAIAVIVLAAGGLYLRNQRATEAEETRAARSGFRTFTVAPATVVRSLRLTGSTAAESYVSLLTPHLRGYRGGGGGSTGSSTTVQIPTAIQSNSGTSSSSSTASPGASTGGNSAGIGVSSGFSAKSALQASTSRTGGQRSSASSSSAAQPAAATASDASGLGSTAGSLLRIGGGGSGGYDWILTLQNAAKPGSIVRKGDVVAEFDRQYMLLRLDDYRAAVSQDQDSLKSLKVQLEVTAEAHEQTVRSAKASVDKARLDIKTIPVRSAIDAEKFRLALEEAEARHRQVLSEVKYVQASQQAQIRSQELGLQQTTIEYNRAAANAEKMIVKAPIGGLVVMRSLYRGGEMAQIQVGDQLWPGMMFMQIVDNRSMIVNATVNQVDVEGLRLGQKAVIHFDAYAGLQLPAHVVAIGAMPKSGGMRQNYVKEVPVRLQLDQIDPRVTPDLTVSVDVQLQSAGAGAAIPREAIFRDSPHGAAFVYVRDGSRWNRREVQTGISSNLVTAIENGLAAGEVVALQIPSGESGAGRDRPPGRPAKE